MYTKPPPPQDPLTLILTCSSLNKYVLRTCYIIDTVILESHWWIGWTVMSNVASVWKGKQVAGRVLWGVHNLETWIVGREVRDGFPQTVTLNGKGNIQPMGAAHIGRLWGVGKVQHGLGIELKQNTTCSKTGRAISPFIHWLPYSFRYLQRAMYPALFSVWAIWELWWMLCVCGGGGGLFCWSYYFCVLCPNFTSIYCHLVSLPKVGALSMAAGVLPTSKVAHKCWEIKTLFTHLPDLLK